MKKSLIFLAAAFFAIAVFISACGGSKKPAELAVKTAEEAVNAAKTEVEKILPEDVKSLDEALAAVKEKFAKGEYKAVVTEAHDLAGKAKELVEKAKAKKEELTESWERFSRELPKMVETIREKVDALTKAKKLPANFTAEKIEEIKAWLADSEEDWTKAVESFKAGNFAEAVATAAAIKEKAEQAMESLGLSVPAAVPAAPETPAQS
ncbi:MAG: hypothetical protein JW950_13115 [Deltaproteobacteria bacterium]|nr:hypothetical protein [Deltaproteobacteria bacterium]